MTLSKSLTSPNQENQSEEEIITITLSLALYCQEEEEKEGIFSILNIKKSQHL